MTTYKDIREKLCDQQTHDRSATIAAFGRSYCYITCPFCHERVRAFIWSLAGGGKRCPGCGALHDNYGTTHRKRPE